MEVVKVGSYVTLFVILLLSWFMALGGLSRIADKSEGLGDEMGLAWFTVFLELVVLIGTVLLGGLSNELFEKSKKFITYMFVILTVFTVETAYHTHVFVDNARGDLKTGLEVATAGFAMLSVMNFLFVAVFSVYLEDFGETLNIPVVTPRPHESSVPQMSTNV